MALLPQDRRGQALLFLTVFAASALYFLWGGTPVGGVPGLSQLGKRRDSLQTQYDSTMAKVRAAQEDVQRGTVAQLERRLEEYRATLDLMAQLVPVSEEVPNLLDDISSRAKIRGATVVNFVPQPRESGSPFDTQRARFTVTGRYDQIGELMADIASLPRIIVPYDLHLERTQSPADSVARGAGPVLQAGFVIRTYVKPAADTAFAARGGG